MGSITSREKMLARARPIVARLPAGKPTLVEVGVFKGQMAEYLLGRRPELRWWGVDSWAGFRDQPKAYIESGDVHAVMTQPDQDECYRVTKDKLARFGDRATIIRDNSVHAAMAFGEGSMDCVYLDADHSREGVEADIKAWWPVVKPGFWIGGHDYLQSDKRFNFGVSLAVDQWVAETGYQLELDEGMCWFVRKL